PPRRSSLSEGRGGAAPCPDTRARPACPSALRASSVTDSSLTAKASLEREALHVQPPPWHAGRPQPFLGDARHRGWPAEVDLALGEVRDELTEVLGGEEQVPVGRGVVADDVVHLDTALALDSVELAGED